MRPRSWPQAARTCPAAASVLPHLVPRPPQFPEPRTIRVLLQVMEEVCVPPSSHLLVNETVEMMRERSAFLVLYLKCYASTAR